MAESLASRFGKTRLILVYLSINYFIVFLDVFIAHSKNNLFPIYEWIPIIFTPLGGLTAILLLIIPNHHWSKTIYMLVNALGVIIGVLGFGFHLQGAAVSSTVSFTGLINTNPVFAPLAFIALGGIGIIAGMNGLNTRRLLIVISFWFFVTAIIAYFDHAITNFTNIYTWIPIYIGIFAAIVVLLHAYSKQDKGLDSLLLATIIISVVVGILGFAFHLNADLAGRGTIVWTKIFYQAPFLAPLLYADLGIWIAIILFYRNTL